MNPNSNPIPRRPRGGNIAPIDLALVAMRLADGSGMHAFQKFGPAFDLLSAAAEFLENRSTKDLVTEAYAGGDTRWNFVDATAIGGPLNHLWKGRQGLEQAIKRLQKKGIIEERHAQHWLKTRSLSTLDISTLELSLASERHLKKHGLPNDPHSAPFLERQS